jgi:hypothetical protein
VLGPELDDQIALVDILEACGQAAVPVRAKVVGRGCALLVEHESVVVSWEKGVDVQPDTERGTEPLEVKLATGSSVVHIPGALDPEPPSTLVNVPARIHAGRVAELLVRAHFVHVAGLAAESGVSQECMYDPQKRIFQRTGTQGTQDAVTASEMPTMETNATQKKLTELTQTMMAVGSWLGVPLEL